MLEAGPPPTLRPRIAQRCGPGWMTPSGLEAGPCMASSSWMTPPSKPSNRRRIPETVVSMRSCIKGVVNTKAISAKPRRPPQPETPAQSGWLRARTWRSTVSDRPCGSWPRRTRAIAPWVRGAATGPQGRIRSRVSVYIMYRHRRWAPTTPGVAYSLWCSQTPRDASPAAPPGWNGSFVEVYHSWCS